MKIAYQDKEWELNGGITVGEAIRKVGLDPESVLATRDGKLINESTTIREDDQIKLIGVISGG